MSRVAVVGGGPAGLTAAVELASRGHLVTLFERGLPPPDEILGSSFDDATRRRLIREHRSPAGDAVIMARAGRTLTMPELGWTSQQVGGGAAVWGGWADRPRARDLRVASRVRAVSSAATVVGAADWPVSYRQLRPLVLEAERMIGVGPDGGRPGPNPVAARLGSIGWRFRPVAMSESARVLWGATAPKPVRELWPWRHAALAQRLAVDVRGGTRVVQLELGPSGTATSLRYRAPDGRHHAERFELFVLACGAIQTVRLLLLSGHQLNRSPAARLIGRYMTFHMFGPQLEVRLEPGAAAQPPLADWRFRDVSLGDADSAPVPGGFVSVHTRPADLTWPGENEECTQTLVLRFTGEDLPSPANCVRLAASVRDRDGVPVALVRRPWVGPCADVHRVISRELRQVTAVLGRTRHRLTTFDQDWVRIGDHQMGGCRMSEDPRRGVTAPSGRLHGVGNVYVVDASVFPTALSVTPTLMTIANCLRVVREL